LFSNLLFRFVHQTTLKKKKQNETCIWKNLKVICHLPQLQFGIKDYWLVKQDWFKPTIEKPLHHQLNGWDGYSRKGETIYDAIFEQEKKEMAEMLGLQNWNLFLLPRFRNIKTIQHLVIKRPFGAFT
jgi:hypothetical protein